jgi:hypothetical protein
LFIQDDIQYFQCFTGVNNIGDAKEKLSLRYFYLYLLDALAHDKYLQSFYTDCCIDICITVSPVSMTQAAHALPLSDNGEACISGTIDTGQVFVLFLAYCWPVRHGLALVIDTRMHASLTLAWPCLSH